MRKLYSTLSNGLKIYEVKLVGGPYDGSVSLTSGDMVYHVSEKYIRGSDDLYYYQPKKQEMKGTE